MKLKYIVFAFIILVVTSCNKLPINGKLDGMWQLQKIEYNTGEIKTPEAVYYAIQLHLVRLTQIHEGDLFGDKSDYYVGRFEHGDNSLYIHDIKVYKNESLPATLEQLQSFGINNLDENFKIEELTSTKMTLRSSSARLSFRKF